MTSELTTWTQQSLREKGYHILSSLESIQTTPWSNIQRILTDKGYIYLKEMPSLLALEPVLIEKLYQQHLAVPVVVDTNSELQAFLMQDAGKPFWHFKSSTSRLALIRDAIFRYQSIQQTCTAQVNTWLALGVPDWRLQELPVLYEQLLNQQELLKKDGLSAEEIKQLTALTASCAKLCDALSLFNIPETLDHCDMHGGNVLIDENTHSITIIDWGETVITHPFFSLRVFLRNLVKYYAFREEEIADYFFQAAKPTDLPNILSLINKLEPVYSALAFYRLWISSDKEKIMAAPKCQGRIATHLREFIFVTRS